MATFERERLVRRVLMALGALGATDAPSAEDAALVEETYAQKADELYEEGLLPFDVEGDIPGRYFIPLTWILARELLADFGKFGRAQVVETRAMEAEKRLWKLRQPPYVHTPTRSTYF